MSISQRRLGNKAKANASQDGTQTRRNVLAIRSHFKADLLLVYSYGRLSVKDEGVEKA